MPKGRFLSRVQLAQANAVFPQYGAIQPFLVALRDFRFPPILAVARRRQTCDFDYQHAWRRPWFGFFNLRSNSSLQTPR
jgi:hypothetical protein